MEEYKRVGEALQARVKESTDVVRYVVLSSAAIIGWLTATKTKAPNPLRLFAWALPAVICLLGMAREKGIRVQLDVLGACLRKVEAHYADGGLEGYLRFNHAEVEERRKTDKLIFLTDPKWFYWLLFGACSIAFLIALASSLSTTKGESTTAAPTVNAPGTPAGLGK